MSASRQVRTAVKTPDSAVQPKVEEAAVGGAFADRPQVAASGFAVQAAFASPRAAVQFKGKGAGDVISTAKSAFQGGGSSLPHQAKVESSFGAGMGNVQAYTGPAAKSACESLGAQAFTVGNQIAFKEASPSVGLVAHEAAHVVQQSKGVQLSGSVGKPGDRYERNADAVAARVVQGKSSADLLGAGGSSAGSAVQRSTVQMLGHRLGEELPEGAEAPEHLDSDEQRQYSVDQYIKMWEAERGRKMNEQEKKTLARGCIGIVALNLTGGGNPPLDHAYGSFDQAKKVVDEWNAFIDAHRGEKTADGQTIGDFKAVLFAKLFWSNQNPDPEKRKTGDPDAFKPDPETGKVDMTGYEYEAQPGYVNFDYGFWDEQSQCFWHANHCQPGMKVYQSTKEKFSKGYIDFDRIIFCAAFARAYKPAAAAAAH